MVNSEVRKRLKRAKDNPVGFKCWDCGEIIEGLKLEDNHYEVSPISLDGYKMLICKECCKTEYL